MRISVIVPVRNEEQSVSNLLEGLLEQSLTPDEIIITDGGSTDSTPSIINRYIQQRETIQLIANGPALPGRGRNLGAARATAEWLAFIDAGVRPRKNWLEFLAQCVLDNDGADVVYGSYEPIVRTLFEECAAICYVPPKTNRKEGWIRAPSIVSALIRKSVWVSVGGFPEHLRSAEDLIFIRNVEQAEFRIFYAPQAIVDWEIQRTYTDTFKRFAVYSLNNIRAGLWGQWQAAIFKRYFLLVLSALPTFIIGVRWLLIAGGFLLLMLVGRAIQSIRRNRNCYPAGIGRNLLRLTVLVPLIATIDVAMFWGTIKWVLHDRLHVLGERLGVSNGT